MVDTARSLDVLHTATGTLFAMASPVQKPELELLQSHMIGNEAFKKEATYALKPRI